MDFKETTLCNLCGDFRKGNQTCQPSKSPISLSTKFLGYVHGELEGLFPRMRQNYRYYISFLEESIGFIDVKPLKFKDNELSIFKNYKALRKK